MECSAVNQKPKKKKEEIWIIFRGYLKSLSDIAENKKLKKRDKKC